MAYSAALAARLRRALGARKGLTEKEMFGGIAFLLDGKMCVGVHGEEIIARVAPEDTDALLKEPGVRIFDMTGRPMKGWLLVGPAGSKTDTALAKWVARGVAFASALPKKAPAKAAPAKKAHRSR